jgi:predicted peptidase
MRFLFFWVCMLASWQVFAQNPSLKASAAPSEAKTSTSKSKKSSKSSKYRRSYNYRLPDPNNADVRAVKDKSLPYQYLAYFPDGYEQSKKKYPMILFLHGRSIQGTNLERVKSYGIIYEILRGLKLDFVVIAPQCQGGWNSDKLIKLLDDVQHKYKVDACRTYLAGMSMGGYGAWFLAGDYPKRFAAVAPVCGGGNLKHVEKLINLPTWVFHGAKDRAVSISESQKMVTALKNKKSKNLSFTIYPNDGHSELIKVFKMKELYEWFMKFEIQ